MRNPWLLTLAALVGFAAAARADGPCWFHFKIGFGAHFNCQLGWSHCCPSPCPPPCCPPACGPVYCTPICFPDPYCFPGAPMYYPNHGCPPAGCHAGFYPPAPWFPVGFHHPH